MISRITSVVDVVLRRFLIALMSIMVITVTWQVITRYLLSAPSSYTAELSTFLLIWISLLGSAYALRLRAHLGIDLISRRLQAAGKSRIQAISYVAVIVFSSLVLVYGGLRLVYVTLYLDQLSAAFRVPMGYIYLAVPLSGLLMIYYSLAAILAPETPPAFDKETVADPESVIASS
jgi:TRAP-type C4-dicarboxylate transport system permease small subunit